MMWRVDRVAKGLAWKASKAVRPRGFESRALRQKRKRRSSEKDERLFL